LTARAEADDPGTAAYVGFAIGAILAAGAFAGSLFVSGIVQAMLIVLALVLLAFTAWMGFWIAVAGFITRLATNTPDHK
jgi:uncharacterized membrane protein